MSRINRQFKPLPLDESGLRDLALAYVGRFATTRARLVVYLERKLRERGWAPETPADPVATAERLAELGYIDDAAFARMKAGQMRQKGLGARRLEQRLRGDGVGEDERGPVVEEARMAAADTARAFARRRRIGPFAAQPVDAATRARQISAFVRAGHDFSTARFWVDRAPGDFPQEDGCD